MLAPPTVDPSERRPPNALVSLVDPHRKTFACGVVNSQHTVRHFAQPIAIVKNELSEYSKFLAALRFQPHGKQRMAQFCAILFCAHIGADQEAREHVVTRRPRKYFQCAPTGGGLDNSGCTTSSLITVCGALVYTRGTAGVIDMG